MHKEFLRFFGYDTNELSFTRISDFVEENELTINPSFSYSVENIEGDFYDVALSVAINENRTEALPFSIKASITGHFEVLCSGKNREIMLNENVVSVMYPYVRAMVSSLTALSNLPAVVLPVVNLSAMLRNERNTPNNEPEENKE